jgi:hypothetical protein
MRILITSCILATFIVSPALTGFLIKTPSPRAQNEVLLIPSYTPPDPS